MDNYGIFTEPGTIQFERLLPGPIDRVWEYLTDADKRGQWLAAGEMELRKGGKVELIFNHDNITPYDEKPPEKYAEHAGESRLEGKIVQIDPPRLLSYTWEEPSAADSIVTFELEPEGEQVRLTLTHRRLGDDHDILISVAGGWHTHLGILIDKLNGQDPKPFWKVHMQMEEEYLKRISE
ncbi:SRPBCC family protein [Fodinibius salsisoli]|uniref:SRPBCC family protein n=1 Tax=Fodinibius salsisoli TaxID=2820877 RepID=A0ABT3PIA6_9BACT|nr:SRPBCC family protein [Fodinibius salsisoli]MCW9705666.1 SRPBCC family protein [Fodinibius salsisoli]